jgi:hypothetical protein
MARPEPEGKCGQKKSPHPKAGAKLYFPLIYFSHSKQMTADSPALAEATANGKRA